MSAVWMRVRTELRARWRASAGLALVIGLAGGLVLASVAGARRQSATFPLFRKTQNTAQLGFANAGSTFGFANIDFNYARHLPQVTDSADFAFYIAFIRTSRGKELTPISDQNPLVSFAGPNARFDTVLDRMFIVDGKIADPNSVDEAVVSYIASKNYDIHVGDTLDYRFPSFKDFANGPSSTTLTGPTLHARVVGIEAESFELPPGLGYPSVHLTPAFYRAYFSRTPTFPALLLKLKHDGDVAPVLNLIQKNAVIGGKHASTRVQEFDETKNAAAIERSVHVQTLALWLLALLAGITSLLVIGQAIVRQSFIESDEHPALRSLGMTSAQVFGAGAIRSALVGMVGAILAIAVAVLVSPLTPIGLVRVINPRPGFSFDTAAMLVGAASVIGVTVLANLIAGFRSAIRPAARGEELRQRPSRVATSLARSSFPPPSVAGVRMALETGRGRTAMPVRSTLFGAIVALAALVTAFVFAAGLNHLLATPRLVGWNWSATVGDDFDMEDAGRVLPVLASDPDVAAYTAGGGSTRQIRGVSLNVVAQDQVKGVIEPVLLDGRAPSAEDELVIGVRAIREIHAHVGDVVAFDGDPGLKYKIVGRAVLPPVTGSTSGDGVFLTFDGLRRLQPTIVTDIYTVRFSVGVDPTVARARLKQKLPDLAVALSSDLGDAGNLQRVVNLPFVLAGLLALLAAATLTHIMLSAVRRRARDLAILRTLGFVGSQVRATVIWQATTLVGFALIVGIPLGVAAGRWSWSAFATQLGYVPEPVVRIAPVLLTIPAALLLGNVISAFPARAAARTKPAVVFRAE